jgi:tRNA A37 threonylcarbamoyladenosine biosynthesis protein TsaE
MPGILSHFESLTLTNDQQQAALAIGRFLESNDSVFLLKGYAGTGKTTLLSGICRYITNVQKREVKLMAPTGRAARILGEKNESQATTIHRGIYNFHKLETEEEKDEQGRILDGYQFVYKLASDVEIVQQVFVIDEASMVSDAYAESEFFRFGSGFLLKDLLTFAKVGLQNIQTQLIFVGDPAQLPPFGMNNSPALDESYFLKTYNIQVQSSELRQVVRQGDQSGVLAMATQIRQGLASGYMNYFEIKDNEHDVRTLHFGQFRDAYSKADKNKIIITYKNKTAKSLNDQIRADRFGANAPTLMPADMIIVGQNNYQHGVTNGTFGMIQSVGEMEIRTVYIRGEQPVKLRWQFVVVLVRGDDSELRTIEAKTLLNFLESDEGKLTSAEMRALFVDFTNRASQKGIKRKTPEFSEALKVDPYFAALMIKHAYAITCHKAQGGEWRSVFTFWDKSTKEDFNPFTDQQLPTGHTNSDFFRWAYTAITRSSDRLLAINPPRFMPFSKMTWVDGALASQLLASQGLETRTVLWGDFERELLERLGLVDSELFIQHKVAEIKHRLMPIGIDVRSVVSKPYQEHLTLIKGAETTRLILHYNSKQHFTRHALLLGSDSIQQAVEAALAEPIKFVFESEMSAQTSANFLYKPDESKPFLATLYEQLSRAAASQDIKIKSVESQQYRERYYLERRQEHAVIDCIYDGAGFFGQVKPLTDSCNSPALLTNIQEIIRQLAY